MQKIYDAIAFKGELKNPEIQELLHPLTDEERTASDKRFGKRKYELTVLTNNHPLGGWPDQLSRDQVVFGYNVIIRGYRTAPEMLPTDFVWERLRESETEKDERGTAIVTLYGGTLLNASRRM